MCKSGISGGGKVMGRLSAEQKAKAPQFEDLATDWMRYIGTIYEDYRKVLFKYAHLNRLNPSDDLLNDTIIRCYESIARNGLKSTDEETYKGFLFCAWRRNLIPTDSYEKRKDGNVDAEYANGEAASNIQPTYDKVKQQLFDDYSTIYIMDLVERNFDPVTFHCFRLKHLSPNCTHAHLREITKVSDSKRRVLEVQRWLKENLTRQQIYSAFVEDFPDFDD